MEHDSDSMFKKLFRVSKGTFRVILGRISHDLVRDTVCEEPISPECRLAICLFRFRLQLAAIFSQTPHVVYACGYRKSAVAGAVIIQGSSSTDVRESRTATGSRMIPFLTW